MWGIDLSVARPLDEAYRSEFDRRDREDVFEGVRMKGFRKCSDDPNRVSALLKFADGVTP